VGGEVLLYFMVRVEVVEIQIGLKFRKDLKIKKHFPIFHWPRAEFSPAGPAWPPIPLLCMARIASQRGPMASSARSPASPTTFLGVSPTR
jgi:hypothetical protein